MVFEVGKDCWHWCLYPRNVLPNDWLGGFVPLDAGTQSGRHPTGSGVHPDNLRLRRAP